LCEVGGGGDNFFLLLAHDCKKIRTRWNQMQRENDMIV